MTRALRRAPYRFYFHQVSFHLVSDRHVYCGQQVDFRHVFAFRPSVG